MANRWMGAALVCVWLGTAAVAHGQGYGEPAPVGGPGCGPMGSPPMPGPMPFGPPGPEEGLGLPPNTANASTPPGCCNTECCPVAYISGEYLLWWIKDPKLPAPLVTTGDAGVLGNAGTVVLLGENDLKYNPFSGGRLTAGFWFDPAHIWALEGSGFLLERRNATFQRFSDAAGNPLLAVPFFDVGTGAENANIVSDPGAGTTGNVSVSNWARFWGAESNLVANTPGCCVCCCNIGLSFFSGFRYLDFTEQTNIEQFTIVTGADPQFSNDQFHTRNQFYGGQVGTRIGITAGRFFLAGQAKIAAGGLHEVSEIAGQTTTYPAAALPTTIPTAFFAQPSNIGRVTRDRFTYVPEGEGRLGIQFTPNVSFWGGYTFMYWDRVLRSSLQIDRNVNNTLVGTPYLGQTQPQVLLRESTLWVQGINVGLEIIY